MLEAEFVPAIITLWMDNGTVLDFVKGRPSIDICPLVCLSVVCLTVILIDIQVNGIASGLNHLHSSGIVHADLKSVSITAFFTMQV